MKITPVAVAVAAAMFSVGAAAGGDEREPQTRSGESASAGGSSEQATPPTTEGMSESGAVISTERTAEPKQQ
jgi:hypothetical protein